MSSVYFWRNCHYRYVKYDGVKLATFRNRPFFFSTPLRQPCFQRACVGGATPPRRFRCRASIRSPFDSRCEVRQSVAVKSGKIEGNSAKIKRRLTVTPTDSQFRLITVLNWAELTVRGERWEDEGYRENSEVFVRSIDGNRRWNFVDSKKVIFELTVDWISRFSAGWSEYFSWGKFVIEYFRSSVYFAHGFVHLRSDCIIDLISRNCCLFIYFSPLEE